MINLEDINSPEFLKQLNIHELEELSQEIREFIISNVSQTGGHLSSNLGVVEATIALHYVFDCPHDKLIFDVGHQCYTHKILTGRAKDFKNLRQTDGLSGFIKYSESEYDCFEAGHSSTSIGAMCGFLEAKEQGADIGQVISFIGDGSMQSSLSLSSLNYLAGRTNQKGIIILNDNGMSISKNVGGMANFLNKVRVNKVYQRFKKITPRFMRRFLSKLSRSIKEYVYGDNYFQSMGIKYIGPIEGNDIKSLIKYFTYAKNCQSSVVIHIKTKKGLGYEYAENDTNGSWHGVDSFDIKTGKSNKVINANDISWSEGISHIVLDLMNENNKILCLTPAMINGSKLEEIKNKYPSRLIDVGINEDLCAEMASSLAVSGNIPISFIYSSFIQRAYDQLNHDIARPNLHAIFMIDRSGIIGNDGDTHQGIFDISIISSLPNFTIMMPKDLNEAYGLLNYAINSLNCPVAFRFPKEYTEKFDKETVINSLNWSIELPIAEVNIISYGSNVEKIKKILEKDDNINIGLINARVIKPIDTQMLYKLNNKTIYVYEEVEINGSLGSLILIEANKLNLNLNIKLIGLNDKYVQFGSVEDLKKQNGLNLEEFIQRIKNGDK